MHSSSNSSTGVNYHLDENKSHTHARNGHPQLRHHALRILRKSPLPLQTEMDRRGHLEAMGSVSRSCCRTPCIQGGSSVVQRNVRQAIPRLCLWNPRPQEMKQTTLASGTAFDSLDWPLFFCILYEFSDGAG